MPPPMQYCLVGLLFLISAIVMAISALMGHTYSNLDILVIVFSVISFFIACHQFVRAFTTWHAMRKKTTAVADSEA